MAVDWLGVYDGLERALQRDHDLAGNDPGGDHSQHQRQQRRSLGDVFKVDAVSVKALKAAHAFKQMRNGQNPRSGVGVNHIWRGLGVDQHASGRQANLLPQLPARHLRGAKSAHH